MIRYCPICKRKLLVNGLNFKSQVACYCKKCNSNIYVVVVKLDEVAP